MEHDLRYILAGTTPVLEPDLLTWARWLGPPTARSPTRG